VHDTAYEHGRLFFALYGNQALRTVVELGSQDVNGSLRDHCPPASHYIGLDVMAAKGVDVVIDPDAALPLASATADAVVTSSAFEHDVCFWNTFLELVRILRPGGLLYLNAPSNGEFHRYPLDCWRFYPDAGAALVQWAARNGLQIELIESFIGLPQRERWADFVAVFRKSGGAPLARTGRIADHAQAINIHDRDVPLRADTERMPDETIAAGLRSDLAAAQAANAAQAAELSAAQQAVSALTAEREALQQRLADLSDDLAAAQRTATALRQDLLAAHDQANERATVEAELRRELAAMQNSRSWRLTAGLRRIAHRVRGPATP
jgi:SAM-dependent methyltransferase